MRTFFSFSVFLSCFVCCLSIIIFRNLNRPFYFVNTSSPKHFVRVGLGSTSFALLQLRRPNLNHEIFQGTNRQLKRAMPPFAFELRRHGPSVYILFSSTCFSYDSRGRPRRLRVLFLVTATFFYNSGGAPFGISRLDIFERSCRLDTA